MFGFLQKILYLHSVYEYLQQDSRMVPNTFEAYVVRHELKEDLDWVVGHVTKIKRRFTDDFISMSKAASLVDSNSGLTMAGFRYNFNEDDNLGLVNYYSWDVMNTIYMEGNYLWQANDEVPVRFSAQFTDQRSVGNELSGNFNTQHFGVQIATSYEGAVLRVAASTTAKGSRVRSSYGARPSYLSIMVKVFDRAGENAWLIGLSYNFKHLSFLKGLSFFTNYAKWIHA